MSELRDVLVSIANHTDVENREHYRNPSIGRGELMMKGLAVPKTIWILNSEPQQTWGVNRDITGAAVSTFHTGMKDAYAEGHTQNSVDMQSINLCSNSIFAIFVV